MPTCSFHYLHQNCLNPPPSHTHTTHTCFCDVLFSRGSELRAQWFAFVVPGTIAVLPSLVLVSTMRLSQLGASFAFVFNSFSGKSRSVVGLASEMSAVTSQGTYIDPPHTLCRETRVCTVLPVACCLCLCLCLCRLVLCLVGLGLGLRVRGLRVCGNSELLLLLLFTLVLSHLILSYAVFCCLILLYPISRIALEDSYRFIYIHLCLW